MFVKFYLFLYVNFIFELCNGYCKKEKSILNDNYFTSLKIKHYEVRTHQCSIIY